MSLQIINDLNINYNTSIIEICKIYNNILSKSELTSDVHVPFIPFIVNDYDLNGKYTAKIPLNDVNKDLTSKFVSIIDDFVLNYLVDIYQSKTVGNLKMCKCWSSLYSIYSLKSISVDDVNYILQIAKRIILQHTFDISFAADIIYHEFPIYDLKNFEETSFENFKKFLNTRVVLEHFKIRPYHSYNQFEIPEDKFIDVLFDFKLSTIVDFLNHYCINDTYKNYIIDEIYGEYGLMIILGLN